MDEIDEIMSADEFNDILSTSHKNEARDIEIEMREIEDS